MCLKTKLNGILHKSQAWNLGGGMGVAEISSFCTVLTLTMKYLLGKKPTI